MGPIKFIGKDPKTQLWVSKFEDGTEDFTTDPQNNIRTTNFWTSVESSYI